VSICTRTAIIVGATTTQVQLTSRANTGLKNQMDVDWVSSYNAWTTPLAL